MTAAGQPNPIYELTISAVGLLVDEFTEAGMWVFFHDDAPAELAEFALLHHAEPPTELIAPGQMLEIDGQRYTITAVGAVANENLRNLGHLVLKANGALEVEMPGDVCIEARPLPQPTIGAQLRIWNEQAR